MTDITITIETDAELLLAHLHYPATDKPSEPLAFPGDTTKPGLPDGLYHVSLAGTGQTPGTRVTVKFAATGSSKSRYRLVKNNGTIGAMVPFFLSEGEVR